MSSPWNNGPRRPGAGSPRPPGERGERSERGPRTERPGGRHERDAGSEGRPRGPRPPYAGQPAQPPRAARPAYRQGPVEPVAAEDATERSPHPGAARRSEELRIHGVNAVQAVFRRRPQDLRKLYLAESRIAELKPLLAWCVKQRVGYRVVDEADLRKLAGSEHHEGVVADVLRNEPPPLAEWLQQLRPGPQLLLWLDGVANPHNFGAILRSAAHFGIAGILLPEHSTLGLSGAAARVAEGGAEAVPLVRLPRPAQADELLHDAGFVMAATLVEGGQDLFATPLPSRLVYVLGAEGGGMDRRFADACDLRLSIPGSGKVESLNVAAATAVLLASWRSALSKPAR